MRFPLAIVAALCASAFAGSAHADLLLDGVNEALQEPLRLLAAWERDRLMAFLLVAGVFLSGALIVALQILPSAKAKAGAIVGGCGVTLLTALGATSFEFDHRQYQAMESQGRYLVAQAESKRVQLQAVPTDQSQTRISLFEDIRADVNAVLSLQSAYELRRRTGIASARLLAAMAFDPESAAPDWVAKAPADTTNLYFVGSASGSDHAAAKQASLDQARASARAFLARRLDSELQAQAPDYLMASARVHDSYSHYDVQHRVVRHYTLLALNRRITESDLRLYRARTSQRLPSGQEPWLHAAARTSNQAAR